MSEWTRVAGVADLKPGDVKQVHAGDDPLCLANVEGEFLATTDICSHEYVNLSEGWLEDDEIECPQHGSKFSMRTGEVLNAPATQPIAVYEVKIEADDVFVRPRAETGRRDLNSAISPEDEVAQSEHDRAETEGGNGA